MKNGPTSSIADAGQPRRSGAVVIACHAWHHEQFGGSFRLATELAEYLAADGRLVCYVCSTPRQDVTSPSIEHGVEVWRYPQPRLRSPHPANLWLHVRRSAELTRQIARRHGIACINGHTPLQFLGALRALPSAGLARAYSVHSPFAEELKSHWEGSRLSWSKRLALRLAGSIERHNLSRADCVIGDSAYTLSCLGKSYPEALGNKGVVCPGWVDLERFQPRDRAETRRHLGPAWQGEDPILLSVRRLEPRMGLDRLLLAVRQVVDSGRRLRLLIGGTGSQSEALRQLAATLRLESHVEFLGRIHDDHLPLAFAAADAVVLPTRALECFGLTILEALASGTPVIATPVGAIPEVMPRESIGWLTDGIEAPHLAARICDFLSGRLKSDPRDLRTSAERFGRQSALARLAKACLGERVNEPQLPPQAEPVDAATAACELAAPSARSHLS